MRNNLNLFTNTIIQKGIILNTSKITTNVNRNGWKHTGVENIKKDFEAKKIKINKSIWWFIIAQA